MHRQSPRSNFLPAGDQKEKSDKTYHRCSHLYVVNSPLVANVRTYGAENWAGGEMPQGEFKAPGAWCQAKAIGRRQAGDQGLGARNGVWLRGAGVQVGRGWESLN
jgi:hypothetical protein